MEGDVIPSFLLRCSYLAFFSLLSSPQPIHQLYWVFQQHKLDPEREGGSRSTGMEWTRSESEQGEERKNNNAGTCEGVKSGFSWQSDHFNKSGEIPSLTSATAVPQRAWGDRGSPAPHRNSAGVLDREPRGPVGSGGISVYVSSCFLIPVYQYHLESLWTSRPF